MPLPVQDQFLRPLRDLRISVTDRCNFRCPYCMPSEIFGPGHAFLRDPQLMKLSELIRIVRAFRALGVEKVYIVDPRKSLPDDWQEMREKPSLSKTSVSAVKWSFVKATT